MITLGSWMRDVISLNTETFRLFGPDETASNRLQDVYEVTDKVWQYRIDDVDEHLARAGRVMEVLSEHLCQGWLEGYLLTGRHGVFSCYEAFIHIVDSMFNQHAKWLKVHRKLPWRQPVASLNYLLSSHVWQQDHNGFSHQDPGFIDHAVNKKAEVIRVYLPPDANTLLSVMEHCLASRDYVNIVVSGKQPSPTWLGPADAAHHCRRGLGIWEFAGSEVPGEEPDVVLACAGDVPTVETVAAAELLKEGAPGLKVRVVNVVDLMRLQDASEHPHGLTSRDFDGIFTADKPIIFAYHGYPSLIHRLAYRRTNQEGLHVRGYKEEGTTTTPFDMAMLNGIDRFQLAIDAIDRVPGLAERHSLLRQSLQDRRMRAREPHPQPRRGPGGDPRLDAGKPEPRASRLGRRARQLPDGTMDPALGEGCRGVVPGGRSVWPRLTARAVREAMTASNMSSEAASGHRGARQGPARVPPSSGVQDQAKPFRLRGAPALVAAGQEAPELQGGGGVDLRQPAGAVPGLRPVVPGDLGLDDGAAHGRVGQPVGGDAERDQPGLAGDEPVRVPVGQQPAAFDPVMVQHRMRVEVQVPGKEGKEGVRPAHGAVDARHVAAAEQLHDLLVASHPGRGAQGGRSPPVPGQDRRRRFLGGGGEVDAQGPHRTRPGGGQLAQVHANNLSRPPGSDRAVPERAGMLAPASKALAGGEPGPDGAEGPALGIDLVPGGARRAARHPPRSAGFRTAAAGQRCARRRRSFPARPRTARSCTPCLRPGRAGGQTSGPTCHRPFPSRPS